MVASPKPPSAEVLTDVVKRLRHDVLVLGSEVTRSHQLLIELDRRVRRAAETTMSFTEHDRAARFAALLRPRAVLSAKKLRLGGPHDGGYVLIDDWAGIAGLISAGAGDDIEFERAVAAHGIAVHLYDHTVDGLPGGTSQPLIEFFREPFGPTGTTLAAALRRMPDGDLLLKVDTDGCEWDTLADQADSLQRFRQIVVELHGLHELSDSLWFERAVAALSALSVHHVPVHAHANNFGSYAIIGGRPVPDIVEVSFARRDSFRFEDASPADSADLHRANDPNRPNYALSFFDWL